MSNVFVIIKTCYVHNQWYDISCATLYIRYHLRRSMLSILPCFSYNAVFSTERRYLVAFLTRWTTAVAQLLPINCHDLLYKASRVCDCITASRTVRQHQIRTWSLSNSIAPSAVRNETDSKFVSLSADLPQYVVKVALSSWTAVHTHDHVLQWNAPSNAPAS